MLIVYMCYVHLVVLKCLYFNFVSIGLLTKVFLLHQGAVPSVRDSAQVA